MTRGHGCALLTAALISTAAASHASPPAAASVTRPVVIAVVGDAGLNVLHHDFATSKDPVLPAGYPAASPVNLPTYGSFGQRLAQAEAGPLGHLRPDTLYRIRGTRIIGVIAPSDPGQPLLATDVLADRLHGTGVASSAVGARYGTAPGAELVFVVGESSAAWQWVANQPWIDLAVSSVFTLADAADPTSVSRMICAGGAAIHQMVTAGRPVFASVGDDDQTATFNAPVGLPDVYQVGGVNTDGTPWMGVHPNESDPTFATGQVTRPYITGDLYSFTAASPDDLTGGTHFGGSSGAAPLTAGRAATLIGLARALLHTPNQAHPGALAWKGPGGADLRSGPLADGNLTGPELSLLLRHTAAASLPDNAAGYATEGYGALTARTQLTAAAVLSGHTTLADRTNADTNYQAITAARSVIFNNSRCG